MKLSNYSCPTSLQHNKDDTRLIFYFGVRHACCQNEWRPNYRGETWIDQPLTETHLYVIRWMISSSHVICTVLLRNNLTENAFGTRSIRVPFAFHSRSIRVPFAFHSRSIRVPFAFHSRSIRVPMAFHFYRNAFRLHSYWNRTSSEIIAISRVLVSVTPTV
jgi:hypothetical protein